MKKAIGIFVLMGCASCWAATPAPAASTAGSSRTAAESLAELEAARALTKARFDLAKQEAELANLKKSTTAESLPPPGSPPPARASLAAKGAIQAALGQGGVAASAPMPVVVGLTGVGGQFTAEVSVGDTRRTVRTGEYLPGGVLVSNIDASGVTFVRDGKATKQRP